MSNWSDSRQNLQFEEVLRDGITAAKNGQRKLAQRLLQRAIMLNASDARPYVWLSATTDDPKEQKDYLEQAISIDPDDASARRGLAMLTGKIDAARLMPEGFQEELTIAPSEAHESQERSFQCSKCGGRMSFSVESSQLSCEYCGHVESLHQEDVSKQASAPTTNRAAQVLDFILPTTRGHHWAQELQHLRCGRCSALSLLPPGIKTTQCPYCGSNQFIEAEVTEELIDPQAIVLMKIDKNQAVKITREWLGRGIFAPDDLPNKSQGGRLRPAYYSFWIFDGTLEVRWTCEISVGSGSHQRWETRNGVKTQLFKDILVPGVRTLPDDDFVKIEPFELADVKEFKPEYLAGWPAVIYDRSLADASLVAREKVMKRLHPQLFSTIEIGRNRRHIQIGSGNWSDMTFKHLLLPIWMGNYLFQGQDYRFLINGQTGKVSGEKPSDSVKLVFTGFMFLTFIVLLVVVYWLFFSGRP
jgi:DNA-directed RNA polymerase subunit RPC12/RpoP